MCITMHTNETQLKQLRTQEIINDSFTPAFIQCERWDVPVAIVGARGYSGLELARLLLKHPRANLTACFGNKDFSLADYLPEASATPTIPMDQMLSYVKENQIRLIFLATPVEASLEWAPKLMQAGVSVVDLSGAFRLSQGNISENYQHWYKADHQAQDWVKNATYGLTAWTKNYSVVQGDALVANPGCFATAILTGLLPLLKENLIQADSLVIDAKSGTTGAGKKAEERLLYSEVEGQCLPYRIGQHQHLPEICQTVVRLTGVTIDPHFTTHLINVRRGIIAGIYAKLDKNFGDELNNDQDKNPSQVEKDQLATQKILEAFQKHYSEDHLIQVAALTPANEAQILNLRRVVGSPRTQIGFKVVGGKLYLFSLIDNLMKGAASQAVENFNQLIGLPSWTGLQDVQGVL